MSGPLTVFVSATSRDLIDCRKAVEGILLDGDIHPKTQEHFPPDHRTLTEFLKASVGECDAVICLVGPVYGAAPESNPSRSYTQMEYDAARSLGKPVFVFLTGERFEPTQTPADGPEGLDLQRRHRLELMQAHKCDVFDTVDQLRMRIALALPRIRDTVRPNTPVSARPAIHYLHPPKPPTYFSGRTEEVRQLVEAFRQRVPSVVAVVGMGGQGKSTLVYHALEKAERFPFAAGFWCTAYRGGFTFDHFLDDTLEFLLDGKYDKREAPGVSARVTRLIGVLQERPVLLVIDGIERWLRGWNQGGHDRQTAETPDQRRGFFEGVDEFLQMASGLTTGTHLVLTSRALPAALDHAARMLVPVRNPTEADISLQGLDPEAAIGLLRSLGVKGTDDGLREAARVYDYHPLALEVLGRLLASRYGGRLTKLSDVTPMDHTGALFQLFEEARTNLPGRAGAERFLVAVAHCLENPPLTLLSDLLGGPTPAELIDQAVTLAYWHLVGWDGETETVSMHPLVQQYYRGLTSSTASTDWHRRLANWYAAQPVPKTATTLDQVKSRVLAVEHALRAADVNRCLDLFFEPMTPLYSFAEWMPALGHHVTARDLLGAAVESATGTQQAHLRIPRAAMLRELGQYQDALTDLDEAICILDGASGELAADERAALAGGLSNRANVYRHVARFTESLADFERSLAILDRLQEAGEGRPLQKAAVLMNRSIVWREMGRGLRRAVEDCAAAAELHRSNLPPVLLAINPDLAAVKLALGNARMPLREYEQALDDYAEAQAIYRRLVSIGQSELRPAVADVQVARGVALGRLHRFGEALAELDEALTFLNEEVRAGRQDLEHTRGLGLMARALAHAGLDDMGAAVRDNAEAVMAFTRLSERDRDMEGLLVQALLGGFLWKIQAGDAPGAREFRQQALERTKKLVVYGEKEILTLFVRFSLIGVTLMAERGPTEALTILNSMLGVVEQSLAGPDPSELMVIDFLLVLPGLRGVSQYLLPIGFDPGRLDRLEARIATLNGG
jgi:tetratricopeptide (TPR) repeat protein